MKTANKPTHPRVASCPGDTIARSSHRKLASGLILCALAAMVSAATPVKIISLAPAVLIPEEGFFETNDPESGVAIPAARAVIADFNGDGLPDVLLSSDSQSMPAIYFNTGTATPLSTSNHQQLNVPASFGPPTNSTTTAIVGDVNGDGRPDIVVGAQALNDFGGGSWLFYLNTGGQYPFGAPAFKLPGNNLFGTAALGDVDGDGHADFVATSETGVSVYLSRGAQLKANSPAGSIQQPAAYATQGASVKIDDVNGDGKNDLIIVWRGQGGTQSTVSIYLNNGTSDPFANVTPLTLLPGITSTAIALADLNQDGRPDLVVATISAGDSRMQAYVFLNSGSKTQPFGFPQNLPFAADIGNECDDVSAADLNDDGLTDLQFACRQPAASAGVATPAVGVLFLNNGTATPFADATPIDLPASAIVDRTDTPANGYAVAVGALVKSALPDVVLIPSGAPPGPAVYFPVQIRTHLTAIDDTAPCGPAIACPINVLANDQPVPGQPINVGSVAIAGGPAHGTVSVAATGVVTYTSVTGYSGTDAFQYTVRDSLGNVSNIATVTLTVAGPVAGNYSLTMAGRQLVTIQVPTSSATGTVEPNSIRIVGPPAHGTAQAYAYTITYTVALGYSGVDTIRYTVSDNFGAVSNAGTITIHVTAPVLSWNSINLAAADNVDAIRSEDQPQQNGGLDGHGYSLPEALLGPTLTWSGTTFPLGSADAPDAASKTTLYPSFSRSAGALKILATAVNGAQLNQKITVNGQVFTQSFSDWGAPQNFPRESIAATLDYRLTPTGERQAGAWHVYGYTIPLDPTSSSYSIQLPQNRDVVILSASFDAPPPGIPVDLRRQANTWALISGPLFEPDTGLDGLGYSYASELLGNYLVWSNTTFQMPIGFGAEYTDSVSNETVAIDAGHWSTLSYLATGYRGPQPNKTLVVHYSDGSSQTVPQSFSDWGSNQHYPGESVAKTMAYRYRADGSKEAGTWNLYGYTIALDSSKIAVSLTLPTGDVTILAITEVP